MSVERVKRKSGEILWRVRWRDTRGRNRSRVLGRKRDAEAFDAEIKRRKRTGDLGALDAGRETLDEYVAGAWSRAHAAHLRPRTRQTYASTYDRHISPRLGGLRLREIDAEVIASFQGHLIRADVGPHAIRKALTLLGGIMQRAAESKRIDFNPQRVVRKARLPQSAEVRPLAPATVEAIRGMVPQRDATIVSTLAYGGLRPGELRGLRWRHVGERTLLVDAEKTGTRRSVRLLAPLRADLLDWRRASGDPADGGSVFPATDGGTWSANAFEKWRRRVFTPALRKAGIERGRPYDLRHSFASLLLHEGRNVIYVARQLGHGAELTMRVYGHVIEELEDQPQLPAVDAIREAREARDTALVTDSAGVGAP
ncbi:MAG: tyrosine-type recombinase/integrase [Actinomycetota bacterium]